MSTDRQSLRELIASNMDPGDEVDDTPESTLGEPEQVQAESVAEPDSSPPEETRKAEEVEKAWEEHEKAKKGKAVKAKASEEDEIIAPPGEMDEEGKKAFAQLPPGLKKFFSKRYHELRSDHTRKTQEASEIRKRYAALDEAVGQYADEYAREGIDVPTLVKRAIAWDRLQKQDPIEWARQTLAAAGVDPSELVEGAQPQSQHYAPQSPRDPRMDQVLGYIQNQEAKRQAEAIEQINQVVARFIQDKPFFKDPGTASRIEELMAPKIEALTIENPNASHLDRLEIAYKRVINENDDLRALAEQAEQRKKLQQEAAHSQRAFNAAASVTGGPGVGSPSYKPASLREAVALAMDGRLN